MKSHHRTRVIRIVTSLSVVAVAFMLTTDAEATTTITGLESGATNALTALKDLIKTVLGKFVLLALILGGTLAVSDRKDWSALTSNLLWAGGIGLIVVFSPEIADAIWSTGSVI